jgi:hypothetical protein
MENIGNGSGNKIFTAILILSFHICTRFFEQFHVTTFFLYCFMYQTLYYNIAIVDVDSGLVAVPLTDRILMSQRT